MPPEFEIRREVELPATPEEVWDAVTARNEAWMFPSGEVEPREGGKTAEGATVTAWDPPHRFAVRFEGEGGFFNALEYVIEGREGATTLMRYTHSGIFAEDWDNQYDAVNQHTDFYLHTLGQYLRYFNGRSATYVGDVPGGIQGPPSSARKGSFEAVRTALGVSGRVGEGDTVHVDLDGLDPLDGVVDYLRPNFVGIRTADGLYRFFGRDAFGMPVGLSLHIFGDAADANADRLEPAWQDWLNRLYA